MREKNGVKNQDPNVSSLNRHDFQIRADELRLIIQCIDTAQVSRGSVPALAELS
jgi:hypothetical protein